jgi:antitoxin component YwqK of YwqJK toxin-antitoxin module
MDQSINSYFCARASSPFNENQDPAFEESFHQDCASLISGIRYSNHNYDKHSDESEYAELPGVPQNNSEEIENSEMPLLIKKYFQSIADCNEEMLVPEYEAYQEYSSESVVLDFDLKFDGGKNKKTLLAIMRKTADSGEMIESDVVVTPTELRANVVDMKKYFELHISETESPIHFWFHNTEKINILQNELNAEYQKLKQHDLEVSDKFIKPGMIVACYVHYLDAWNRAEIVEKTEGKNEMVRVFFFDHGTTSDVEISSLKLLKNRFLDYPKYAHRGRIPNLQPTNNEIIWSTKTIDTFIDIFNNQTLRGRVLQFNETEKVYELEIIMKNDDGKEISAREFIIENKIAEELEKSDILPLFYHFPNFEMLESTYLRHHEKGYFEENKHIDIGLLIETNFLKRVRSTMTHNDPRIVTALSSKKMTNVKRFLNSFI